MYLTKRSLIRANIAKSRNEILFIKAIFSLTNCVCLLFITYIFTHMPPESLTKGELYEKLTEMIIALFAPYLAFVAQGYCYPHTRNINVLRYLLFKRNLVSEDITAIYGK